ncbi:hypothetical protein Pcinc_026503 [Petrolisthes cinctipes]|uniref:C2H2-type domain-containing protein n=1 Tax=Petrolisthes cinctipes TaxID=88211 RepID=A0AAE1F5T8_PETCI|nr:hypothetical protein Pcinc_030924 [Petrolisthes cinctipes]KAK3868079.1 hypothetical protein Pcinc_026503 [Petrolisthes cinctipes]
MGGGEEARQHYEIVQEQRHPPPLDLRGGGEAVMGRGRLEEPRMEERQPTSPPLPPSSLPHSCQLCGKLISCRRNLWKHMERVHFNNPAVRCSLCAKMFKNKYALKDHQRIYHGGLSEPPPPPPPPQPQSTSLLSRILQDPRHQQHPEPRPPLPHDLSQPPMLPRDSHLRHHLEPPRRRHHEEDDIPGGGGGGYPGMGMGGMMPQALGPPASLAPPRPDWPTQENPMSLVNRAALLSELHHLVTKAD